jgi:hypothetical protein
LGPEGTRRDVESVEPSQGAAWRVERLLARRFRPIVALLIVAYLVTQLVYVARLPLCEDEFSYAATLHRLPGRVPYRDFTPYRTMLGYYVWLAPMKLPLGPFGRVIATKAMIAVVNAACLATAALALARRFGKEAVCLGLALLVVMSTFLERSSVLRVDMLASWIGLASFLILLEGRAAWAGALSALAFFVCPKAAYFIVATDAALAASFLAARRDRERAWDILRYNAAAFAVLLVYVGFWSTFSSPSTVIHATFSRKAAQLISERYDPYAVSWHFWVQTVTRNPFFYGIGLAGLFELFRRLRSGTKDRGVWIHAVYATVVLLVGVAHRFPWTYVFVMFIPTVWVLAMAFFDARLSRPSAPALGVPRAVLILYVAAGVVLPLTRLRVTLTRDAGFQKDTVRFASTLLEPDEQYFAGVAVLYERDQPALEWLDPVVYARLDNGAEEEIDGLIDAMEEARLKLYIHTNRFSRLPGKLKAYLRNHYAHLWGNVYVYGPAVRGGEEEFRVKFGGEYEVVWAPGGTASIDGKELAEKDRLALAPGVHRKSRDSVFQLRLLPPGYEEIADPRYREPWALFVSVFRY